MFRDDFKAELEYLQQLCEELGHREPTLAPMLGRGADPAVSRLLEGLAFSFGRLRQRLDDDMPEIIHPVVENLCPELLRPIPSGTIVELVPAPKLLARHSVLEGSTFASRVIDGTTCYFRSTVDCEVSPWALRRVEVTGSERRSVLLSLELFPGTELADALPEKLSLFFAHPIAMALEARALFLHNVTEVIARTPDASVEVRLPLPVARPRASPGPGPSPSPSPSDTSLPSESPDVPTATAFLTLRDYFVFPQSFAFVELLGFDALKALGPNARTVELELVLDAPLPKGIVLDRSTVRLHAVPTVNIFRPQKLNLPLRGDKRHCAIRLDGELVDAEVYAVDSVALVSRGLRRTPIEAWAKLFQPPDESEAAVRYEVHREVSTVGLRLDVSLSFNGKDAARLLEDKDSAEATVWATNGERAFQVDLGGVCVPTATSPSLMTFRNITPVTRCAPPSIAGDRLWRFYRLVKANLAALTDTDSLAAILALANVPAQRGFPDAKPDAERFVPLLCVTRRREQWSVRDEIHAGAVIHVTVDARRFSGRGDVRLFGEVLAPLFVASISTHEWVELALLDSDGSVLAHYPRTHGARVGP